MLPEIKKHRKVKKKKLNIIQYISFHDLFAGKAHISLNKYYLSFPSARRPSVQVRRMQRTHSSWWPDEGTMNNFRREAAEK